jgi:cellulose synthase/poly-beta-1,6-N-acetylglucosamine synthase-like glycosyltransferase
MAAKLLPRLRRPGPGVIERVLLGTPSRPFVNGSPALTGRTQTRWGRWWDAHPRLLRTVALFALVWMATYLTWRVGWSWHGASRWLWAPLLLAEGYGLWSLSVLTWFSWRLPGCERPPTTLGRTVDVYVCTYDEPVAVLRPTLAGCAALTYPHTTYVLDDGRRPEIAALAQEWGAEYLTRPDNAHAKAGNINHALPRTGGELVLALDADHVPLPDALDALVGYFDDPDVALVQTPHDFYNHDSIQHYDVGRHEQSVFYSVICPGKDRHGAAFWCGSGALIHRHALMEVGGVATDTIAEDFHTTIKFHRAGWKTRYHDEVLIQGLAPHDLAAYLLQRDRWARGNLAVFTTGESPLRAKELSRRQRLSYFASLSAYLAGPMRLLMLLTLAAVLWSGQLPLTASPLTLGLLWGPATLLSIMAGSALCRGYQRIADTTHFELCTAEIFTRALRCVVKPGRTVFRVTPKEGVDLGGAGALRQLPIVMGVAALLGSGLVLRVLDESGVNVLPNLHGMALWVVPVVGAVELRRMLRTLALVSRRRQLRMEYRMPLDAPVIATAAGAEGTALVGRARDISPSGIGLELPAPLERGACASATVELPTLSGGTASVALELQVQSCRPVGDGWAAGTRIVGCDETDARRLVEYCYVVCQERRLRGARPVALPRPATIDFPALEPVGAAQPAAAVEPAAA